MVGEVDPDFYETRVVKVGGGKRGMIGDLIVHGWVIHLITGQS